MNNPEVMITSVRRFMTELCGLCLAFRVWPWGSTNSFFITTLCEQIGSFWQKVLWKRERGQVVGQHFCSTHTLIRAGISITLAHNDLYWSQQPEQEKGRTCSYCRGMDKKRQHRRKEVGRDRDRDDKGVEWGLEESKDAVIISVMANYCFLILSIDRSICAHPAQCCLLLLREIQ